MKVIVFGSDQNELVKTLEKMIHRQLPAVVTRYVSSPASLSRELCRPLNQIAVIIVLISSEKEILQMLGLKPVRDDIRQIIVFVGNNTRSMQFLAVRLGPSFIGSSNRLDDVLSVLKKIVRRIEHGKQHVAERLNVETQ